MNYVIYVKNEDESKCVQRILFSAGKRWPSSEGISFTNEHFLHVSEDHLALGYSGNFEYITQKITSKLAKALNANRVTEFFPPLEPEKMIEIDGKKWSESSIKEMIKRYVNE